MWGWILNLPPRMGDGQGAKLSVPNSQWTNVGKAAKAESRSGTRSQTHRWATSTQQKSEEAQRLRVELGQQANLPKQGMWWIPELILWDRGQHSKQNCPTSLREELTKQNYSWRATQLQPAKNNNSSDLADLTHLTIATNTVDRRTK
jgi:hypothetical protein